MLNARLPLLVPLIVQPKAVCMVPPHSVNETFSSARISEKLAVSILSPFKLNDGIFAGVGLIWGNRPCITLRAKGWVVSDEIRQDKRGIGEGSGE